MAVYIPKRFPWLDYREKRILTINYSPDLVYGESLLAILSVSVQVDFGSDPNAAATILGGGAQIQGNNVLIPVGGFVNGSTDYRYTVVCSTTNGSKTLTGVGVLPVRVF